MKSYKAIGFDWGGVLNGKPGGYFHEAIKLLPNVTLEEFATAYFSHNQKLNRGEITWNQLWLLVLAELGYNDNERLARQIAELGQAANADSLNLEMVQLVDALKENGYKVGLLSNNIAAGAALMREKGLDKHFDVVAVSCETGLVKPDPQAFQYLADSLGVAISELIFIDDTKESLATAEAIGFMPILFESYEQLIRELNSLNINTSPTAA